ncbi:hypothetical protein MANES_18G008101v8 [Manihot esculenta]|uniref:Uncharacterized protein n=1 Tax=Manihot esculenta TaxID=3983 RepID=A0ACB7FXS3_MANES|nr:hypothetical protein MANES_18G008101v8 [Manihot esculenta]
MAGGCHCPFLTNWDQEHHPNFYARFHPNNRRIEVRKKLLLKQ